MYRPAVNRLTGNVDLINIETCHNIEDYTIVGISNEANEGSISVNGDAVATESPTRKIALEQEQAYEKQLIDEALAKNESVKKSKK